MTAGENAGQSFEEWDKDRIILDLNNHLKDFSRKTKKELIDDNSLVIYNEFPINSRFKYPKAIPNDGIVKWARLRISGRCRIAGFFTDGSYSEKDIFYVVFLDKNHDFYPVEKKHT